jgi:NTP pyrophosphatase (non-canonical NTP hydrolase)
MAEDMLEAVFRRQAEFAARIGGAGLGHPIGTDWDRLATDGSLSEEDAARITQAIDTYATCITQEAAELRDWVPWKHWSQSLGNKADKGPEGIEPWTEEHLYEMRVEVADLLCFLVNTAMWLGMGAAELNAYHTEKVGVNHARQDEGKY